MPLIAFCLPINQISIRNSKGSRLEDCLWWRAPTEVYQG